MSLWQLIRQPSTPPAPALAPWLDRLLGIALAALGFFLPWSVAGVVGSIGALFLLALAAGPALWRSVPWREPTIALGLVLLGFIAIHTLVMSGIAPVTWHTVNRYHELLLLPLLLVMFRLGAGRRGFFRALLVGTVLYALAFWFALLSPKLAAWLLPRRISAGFGLAVCAFLFLEMARCRARPWLLRTVAAFLAVTVLFAIDGRTGHIVVLALAGCAAWMHSPRRWRWSAAVVLPLAVLAAAWVSPTVQKRLAESMAGTQPMADGTLSSTGIRIEMMRNNMDLARDHYAVGTGYANYARVHEQATQQRYSNDPVRQGYLREKWVRTANPHNEFLMQLIGGGLVAAALFVAWLALPLVRRETAPGTRGLLAGLVIAFAIGCLFNSLLMDFVEGHLYVTLLAWLLARQASFAAPGVRP